MNYKSKTDFKTFHPVPFIRPIYAPHAPHTPLHHITRHPSVASSPTTRPFSTIFATAVAARTPRLSSTHSQNHLSSLRASRWAPLTNLTVWCDGIVEEERVLLLLFCTSLLSLYLLTANPTFHFLVGGHRKTGAGFLRGQGDDWYDRLELFQCFQWR